MVSTVPYAERFPILRIRAVQTMSSRRPLLFGVPVTACQ